MTLVIMAAGMGSRYGGLKQIDPVGKHGEFIIDYSIYDAIGSGFRKVVIMILKENLDLFRETIGKRLEREVDVDYAFQTMELPLDYHGKRSKPWGTAQAILCARGNISENFAAINADDFYGRSVFETIGGFLKDADPAKTDYAMPGYILNNTLSENGHVARGVCSVDASGFLREINERIQIQINNGTIQYYENGAWYDLTGKEPVSMNFWGFTPRIFDSIEQYLPVFFQNHKDDMEKAEYYLPWVIGHMLGQQDGSVRVFETDAKWFGVTYPEDKQYVVDTIQRMIDDQKYPERLWKHG